MADKEEKKDDPVSSVNPIPASPVVKPAGLTLPERVLRIESALTQIVTMMQQQYQHPQQYTGSNPVQSNQQQVNPIEILQLLKGQPQKQSNPLEDLAMEVLRSEMDLNKSVKQAIIKKIDLLG